ncbi:MAG: Gldg family protein, partial [Candidatus Cloacimonetes bacterium]|nr:Gldg family protein [Candidatus Cloacimonadota bacterium]
MKKQTFLDSATSGLVLLVALLALNVLSSQLIFKLDITEERLYSLSQGTKSILSKLEDTVHVKYYFTKSND